MTSNPKPLVYLVGTGGTIAVNADDRTDYTDYVYVWGQGKYFTIEQLVDRIPEVKEFARVKAEQFANLGSTGIYSSHLLEMARYINRIFDDDRDAAGLVLTHGTATLEETAYFLNLTVKSDKPVVVTGSMRPPSAYSSDTEINLIDSIRVACDPEAKGKGVLTLLNNEIQAARDVTKTNTFRLETFQSREFGVLGYADSDHQVVFYRTPIRRHTYLTEFDVNNIDELSRVDIVNAYLGADGLLVRTLIDAGVPGFVVSSLGSGATPPKFMEALKEALEKGMVVVMSTQTGSGRVAMTREFEDLGIVVSDNLTPRKARILLMLALSVTKDIGRIQEMMNSY